VRPLTEPRTVNIITLTSAWTGSAAVSAAGYAGGV